ncbi:hypothetical protein [Leptospira sarikeiensis]|uniref:Uncharacterized protein n=1 Tax=Leptospira sarikeiensis TaxID=2484943 RepID=A0A4R9K4U0_9LEPT|nr:hypothetical protein [Leptospira sarikeiensis]TGL61169.1 hypothetical protein EHQ64_11170 [Leptospira sarikeiensis]
MAEIEKKERKLKKSEEKQIEKIVEVLRENPGAILWVSLILNKFMNSSDKSEGQFSEYLLLKNMPAEKKKKK